MSILRQSAEWVIALGHRFTHDIFFSSRVKITICLTLFVAIVIAGFFVLTKYLESSYTIGLTNSGGESKPEIYISLLILIGLGTLCTLIVSRLSLAPIREAFHMQRRFISGIAHELRTPLSTLRMNNEIARMEIHPSLLPVALLDENISDIDMISEILNNLLLFDRMMTTQSLSFEEVSLRKIGENAAKRLDSLATQKNISITITDDDSTPTVRGNKTTLDQVFFNILKNSISYTPKDGEVHITYMGKTDRMATIRISDTGVGIPERDLPHIFEPFYRSDKAGKLSGTGIGLAVVCEIIKLHEGSIEVESTEGKGTAFFLSFPLSAGPQRTQPRFPRSLFSN